MTKRPLEQQLLELRHDVTAVTLLLEFLYVMQFRPMRDGIERFQKFSGDLKKDLEGLALSDVPAAIADDATQATLEVISAILDRIAARLKDSQHRAHQTPQ